MSRDYYSDLVHGEIPRDRSDIPSKVCLAIIKYIELKLRDGSFARKFPELCQDGRGVCGTDEASFTSIAVAHIPNLCWPLEYVIIDDDLTFNRKRELRLPTDSALMDFIQFCFDNISYPIQNDYHSYFGHHHLSFDDELGKKEFCDNINKIFSRNGLAYELQESGSISHLNNPILDALLRKARGYSVDKEFDDFVESAIKKISNFDLKERKDGLKDLWDAWERIKTIEVVGNKRESVKLLLDNVASEGKFRELLEKEAQELNSIGNSFMIRHSETDKTPIENSNQVEYLFHRMFSFIDLAAKSRA